MVPGNSSADHTLLPGFIEQLLLLGTTFSNSNSLVNNSGLVTTSATWGGVRSAHNIHKIKTVEVVISGLVHIRNPPSDKYFIKFILKYFIKFLTTLKKIFSVKPVR